ncbi:LysR family transcriptional regulator [Trinickia mobilis]|uniref:LysR family transcriptional regulator n=1 Tax=Trinickia mobilis TaxID=2816356 RepID=UPI001A8E3ABC|nr:LysR family transcriptional regulator [Trinickia mobilis]
MDRVAAMAAFVHVVDSGSFSAAASQMRVGQSSVSKVIAQLEDHLGVRLLFRSSRALSMTDAGLVFYERAKQAIAEIEEAEFAARGAGAQLSGRLRFSAPVTFARLHIMPVLLGFMEQHPELKVEAVLDDQITNLVEESIDIALRLGPLTDSALVARRIGRCDRFVIGTPAYFHRVGAPATPDDLTGLQAIVYPNSGGGWNWSFSKNGTVKSVSLREHMLVTAAEGVREAVFTGAGFAIGSEWMFSSELETGKVIAVLTDWELKPLDLWAVYQGGRQTSAKSRAFAVFVEEVMRRKSFAPS